MEMPDLVSKYTPQVADYIRSVAVKEPVVLARLREETAKMPDAQMQISPEQAQFFQFLIRATGARRCLEIGVFTGYSSTAVALALPEDGHLTACDRSAEYTAVARRYWREAGVEQKIHLELGPAVETLDELIKNGNSGSFDFAFVDADKPNYPNYWERTVALVRTGGVIAVDNVLRSERVADPAIQDSDTRLMRDFNRIVAADTRVESLILPLRDGITLAVKL
jgi:predicted O-methyltransferase YrrM